MDDLTQLLHEAHEADTARMHTSFPAVVVSYDADTRRADVQPSLKRKMPDGSYSTLPVIPDVPVLYAGTAKYTVTFPLEPGDEVLCVASERSIEAWKDTGGEDIADNDTRRFSLMDCVAIPGLQAVTFPAREGEGFCIVHENEGEQVASIAIDDDKIEIKRPDVTMRFAHGRLAVKADKDLFTVLQKTIDDMAQAVKKTYSMNTAGSPANHVVAPSDKQALMQSETDLKQDNSDLAEVMEAV